MTVRKLRVLAVIFLTGGVGGCMADLIRVPYVKPPPHLIYGGCGGWSRSGRFVSDRDTDLSMTPRRQSQLCDLINGAT